MEHVEGNELVPGAEDLEKASGKPVKVVLAAAKWGCALWLGELILTRFWGYLYDFICSKLPFTKRYRELSAETLTCRYCGNEIDLLGAWQCECGFRRPGKYFARCPHCMRHPRYIDCPACRFTMDVR